MRARPSKKEHVLAKTGLGGEEERRATGTITQVDRRSSRQKFPHDVDMGPGRGQVLGGKGSRLVGTGSAPSRRPNVPVESADAVFYSTGTVPLRRVLVASPSYRRDRFPGGGR